MQLAVQKRSASDFHEDHRRTLSTAFNGEFTAGSAIFYQTPIDEVLDMGALAGFQTYLFVANKEGSVEVTTTDKMLSMRHLDTLTIPAGTPYEVMARDGTLLAVYGETGCDTTASGNPETAP